MLLGNQAGSETTWDPQVLRAHPYQQKSSPMCNRKLGSMRKMPVHMILAKSNITKPVQQNKNKKCNVEAKTKTKNNLTFA